MALADYSAYKTAVNRKTMYPFTKATGTAIANRLMSHWLATPNAGATPSTAAVPTAATTGAILTEPRLSTFTNALYMAQMELMAGNTIAYAGFLLCDRLSHQGGLSAVSSATQTTNLPTSALTRYTSGEGVIAVLETYTFFGTTTTTVTASYTNQAGTAGQTTKAVSFGGLNNRDQGMVFPLPLQDGDTGVRSVESVTLVASTGTIGNFGVTLYKPLLLLPNLGLSSQATQPYHYDGLLCSGTKLSEIEDAACLCMLGIQSSATSFVYSGACNIIEVS